MPGQALQLYTLREFTKTADAVRTTLERVREIGFRAVQVSAVAALDADMSPDDLGRLLRELDLRCIATHRPWASLLNEIKREIDLHKAIGCDYVAIGGIPDGYDKRNPAEYERFLDESLAVRSQLASAGIRFGHHNHAFEFDRGMLERMSPLGMCLSILAGHITIWSWMFTGRGMVALTRLACFPG